MRLCTGIENNLYTTTGERSQLPARIQVAMFRKIIGCFLFFVAGCTIVKIGIFLE